LLRFSFSCFASQAGNNFFELIQCGEKISRQGAKHAKENKSIEQFRLTSNYLHRSIKIPEIKDKLSSRLAK